MHIKKINEYFMGGEITPEILDDITNYIQSKFPNSPLKDIESLKKELNQLLISHHHGNLTATGSRGSYFSNEEGEDRRISGYHH